MAAAFLQIRPSWENVLQALEPLYPAREIRPIRKAPSLSLKV
jgi:hypothetical protein